MEINAILVSEFIKGHTTVYCHHVTIIVHHNLFHNLVPEPLCQFLLKERVYFILPHVF